MFFMSRIKRWFHDRGRNIFKFYDGKQWRRMDPIVISSRLEEHCPDYQELLIVLTKSPLSAPVGGVRDDLMRQRTEASNKLAAAAQKVFNVEKLTESEGLTLAESIGVLTRYFLFMEELAAAAELFPDSPGVA